VAVGAKGVQNTFVLYSILAFLSSEGIQIPQSCSPQGMLPCACAVACVRWCVSCAVVCGV
jgi:hypothetical protein